MAESTQSTWIWIWVEDCPAGLARTKTINKKIKFFLLFFIVLVDFWLGFPTRYPKIYYPIILDKVKKNKYIFLAVNRVNAYVVETQHVKTALVARNKGHF